MDKNEIKGVVFDFGGVMTTKSAPERIYPIIDGLGVSMDVVRAGFAKYRCLMDADLMSIREMYSLIFEEAGLDVSAEDVGRIIEADMTSFLHPNAKTLEWMGALKSRGFKIGILTNMSTQLAARFRQTFADFVFLADAMVISGEERTYKPRIEIYRHVETRIGLPPGEICFVDDSETNCAGARAAGWKTVLFKDNAQAVRDFEALVAAR